MAIVAIISHQAISLISFRGALISAIISRGHKVVAFAPDYCADTEESVKKLGAEVRRYSLSRTGLNPIMDVKSLLQLRRLLAELKPHICLSYTVKPVIYGTLAAAIAKVPKRVAMIEGLGYTFTNNERPIKFKKCVLLIVVSLLYRLSLASAHSVLTLNKDDLREFVRLRLTAKSKLFCVGGIGVDLLEWPQVNFPAIENGLDAPITFTLIARLLKEKGIIEYVQAARNIKKLFPRSRFQLLGSLDDNPGAISRKEVDLWVEEGIIEWPGYVDVRKWLGKTHVFVLPSYREGVPRSTQEAMAMGRPVITTDVPGCRDTVIDGFNGFMVPPRDVPALVTAMERFINEPQLIERFGQASRQLAEERFDVHKVNNKLLQIMEL